MTPARLGCLALALGLVLCGLSSCAETQPKPDQSEAGQTPVIEKVQPTEQAPAPRESGGPGQAPAAPPALAPTPETKEELMKKLLEEKKGEEYYQPNADAEEAFNQGLRVAYSDPPAAAQAFKKALDRDSGFYTAAFNLGLADEGQGQAAEAERQYRRALAIKPDYEPAAVNLAMLLARLGKKDVAEQTLREAIHKKPGGLKLRNALCTLWLAQGRQEEVLAEAKAILKTDELNVGAKLNLAGVYLAREQFELVQTILRDAQANEPKNAHVYYLWSKLCLAQNDSPCALEKVQKAVSLQPDMIEALNDLGALLIEVRKFTDAEQHLREALRRYPDYADAYINLGSALRGQRKFKEAEAAFLKARQLKPNDAGITFNLGILHLDNYQLEKEAKIAACEKAIDLLLQFKNAYSGDDSALLARADSYLAEANKRIVDEKRNMEIAEKRAKSKKRLEEEAAKAKAEEDRKAAEEAAKKAAEGPKTAPGGGEPGGLKNEPGGLKGEPPPPSPARSAPRAPPPPPPSSQPPELGPGSGGLKGSPAPAAPPVQDKLGGEEK